MHQPLLNFNSSRTTVWPCKNIFVCVFLNCTGLFLPMWAFIVYGGNYYIMDVTSVECIYKEQPWKQLGRLDLKYCVPLLPNVTNLTCCDTMVSRPELLPRGVEKNNKVRTGFYVSVIFYMTMMVAAVAKLNSLVCHTPHATEASMRDLLHRWMLMREVVESMLIFMAYKYQLVLSEIGVDWEIWLLIFVWFFSCHLAEACTLGEVSPTSVFMSAVPTISGPLVRMSYRVQALLCFDAGGIFGYILFIFSITSFVLSMCISSSHYPRHWCEIYFAASLENATVTLDLLSKQHATSSCTASCKGESFCLKYLESNSVGRYRFGFLRHCLLLLRNLVVAPSLLILACIGHHVGHAVARCTAPMTRIALDQIEKMTRPIQMEQALMNHLPHTIIAICFASLREGSSIFLLLNVATGTSKIIVLFFARLWVLQKRSEYGAFYALVIKTLHVLAIISKFLFSETAFLYIRIEFQIVKPLVEFKLDMQGAKERSEKLYRLCLVADHMHNRSCGFAAHRAWVSRQSKILYVTALAYIGGRENWEEAQSLSLEYWQRWKVSLGEAHKDTLDIMSCYSYMIGQLGRIEESAELDYQCWQLQKSALGEAHKDTLLSMTNYSWKLRQLGRIEESAELDYQCWQLQKSALGEAHAQTLLTMNNYSWTIGQLGRIEEQTELHYQCWQLRKSAWGEAHAQTLESMSNYSWTLGQLGRIEESAELDYQCWQLRKSALGEAHKDTLLSMSNYSWKLGQLGRIEESAELNYQCWQLRKSALGEADEDTLESMRNYSWTIGQLGRIEESAELDYRCWQLQRSALGETF